MYKSKNKFQMKNEYLSFLIRPHDMSHVTSLTNMVKRQIFRKLAFFNTIALKLSSEFPDRLHKISDLTSVLIFGEKLADLKMLKCVN